MGEVKVWRHTRKGIIRGRIVKEYDEWAEIELSGFHELTLANPNTDPFRETGEVITVRKSFLTEIVEEVQDEEDYGGHDMTEDS
jgi:hypothetical protein